jgi:cell division protein FtsW
MILAVIGEELGFAGITAVLFLYGMIAYAGLRAARTAKDLYSKLVAAGITSVILSQATINFFAVLGLLPLTGVPLPFISYGNSNLIVLLAAMGVLMNIAQQGAPAAAAADKRGRGRKQQAEAPPAAARRRAVETETQAQAGGRSTDVQAASRYKEAFRCQGS